MRRSITLLPVLLFAACTNSGGADPTMCTDAQCRPPTCCGDSCSSNADCCEDTICSTGGRCIPFRCAGCGELGCLVDYDACTAECAPPASCGETCGSDADCATGTTCSPSVTGELRCYPDACASCGGLTPLCRIAGDCGVTCVAPERCGEECDPGSDCGPAALCHSFPSGISRCVPTGFQDECSLCGSLGCSFWPSTCDVTCGAAETDAGTPPVGRDAGTSPEADGGTPPVGRDAGGTVSPPPEEPSCRACCSPCDSDADCCPGSSCLRRADTGELMCFPSECAFCTYGCTYRCP